MTESRPATNGWHAFAEYSIPTATPEGDAMKVAFFAGAQCVLGALHVICNNPARAPHLGLALTQLQADIDRSLGVVEAR